MSEQEESRKQLLKALAEIRDFAATQRAEADSASDLQYTARKLSWTLVTVVEKLDRALWNFEAEV